MVTCNVCGTSKSLEDAHLFFDRQRRNSKGFRCKCKKCRRAYRRSIYKPKARSSRYGRPEDEGGAIEVAIKRHVAEKAMIRGDTENIIDQEAEKAFLETAREYNIEKINKTH